MSKKAKKPGGQAGNKNALKHGLWATRTADTKTIALDLRKEIAYLEGVLERMADKFDAELTDNNTHLTKSGHAMLSALPLIIDRRITAVRSQAFISGELTELEKEIEEGIFLARSDLGILDYLTPPEQLPRKTRKGGVS